jgi:glycerophosphoryl diester phosphodiesterase
LSFTEIASHRGGALLWPENSVQAFRHALALPAEQLELDVHLSADGVPFVLHDATLDRMTDGRGPILGLSAATLDRLRVKGTGGEAPPRLSAAAAMVRQAGRVLRMELKCDADGRPYPGIVPACCAVLDALAMRGQTTVMAFEPMVLASAIAEGGWRRGVLLLEARPWRGMGTLGAIALARAAGAEEIGLPIGEWDAAAVAAVRAAGIGVSAWGCNDVATIADGYSLGLDAIATDDPPLAIRQRSA